MRPKTVYFAAYRHGRILPGSLLDTAAAVRRYVRAMYAHEVCAGLHKMSEVFTAHGITVEKVMIVRFGIQRLPAPAGACG